MQHHIRLASRGQGSSPSTVGGRDFSLNRRDTSSRFALMIPLFFQELLGVFRPISRRDPVFLNGFSESLAQGVKVKGPHLLAFGAVRFCVARPHGGDGMHRKFNLSRINARLLLGISGYVTPALAGAKETPKKAPPPKDDKKGSKEPT